MQDGAPDQISAADYDPSLDRREDEQRRVLKDEPMDVETIEEEEEEEEDDVDDMFAAATTEKKRKKVKKVVVCPHYFVRQRCLTLYAEKSSTRPYHNDVRLRLRS